MGGINFKVKCLSNGVIGIRVVALNVPSNFSKNLNVAWRVAPIAFCFSVLR